MERWRCVLLSGTYLALLVEVLVGRQDVRTEDAEGIAVELVAARLADQANHASGATLIGSWSVLGFDTNLVDAVLGQVHSGNDSRRVVFGDAQRAAIDHVINRADNSAVNRVRRNVDTGAAAGDVLDRKRA
jgi:hypothetical protein